ncbi:transporter [Butyrivibrio proteoclasticus]|uniref:transporter n=1 Tax=Butyrivibrio proteoclasticus TaxID=43305 RepID=UPI000A89B942|nr:transporter [Butyrivibrio proteoclasticus]
MDKKKKIGIVDILMLQGAVVVYSLSTVAAKLASGHPFLSFKYILFFGLEFIILGVYAIVWQQMIKKFQLSLAYANKALTLMWSMLWNFVIFSQGITPWKVVGVVLVVIGVIIMNTGAETDEDAGNDALKNASADASVDAGDNANKEVKL